MLDELKEGGMKLLYSVHSGSDYGTEYLDRTIYHTVYVTDANGKVLVDGKGSKIMRNQVLYLAGSYISKKEYQHALEVEKDFKDLNDRLREKMDSDRMNWRINRVNQKALSIQGVTGI